MYGHMNVKKNYWYLSGLCVLQCFFFFITPVYQAPKKTILTAVTCVGCPLWLWHICYFRVTSHSVALVTKLTALSSAVANLTVS